MENLLNITIVLHVIAGCGALIIGALAIILKKNTPKHKPIGKLYFWCMTIVFISSIFVSIVKGLLFLFMIGIFTYYATLIAYRALKLKNLHNGQKPHIIDWLIEIIAGITFLGMVVFAILLLSNQNDGGYVAMFFGVLGVIGVYRNVKKFITGQTESMYWLKKHIGNMCGSYIGAITAFTVNQADHIPLNPIILWIGPTVIIVPIIFFELNKLKSKTL